MVDQTSWREQVKGLRNPNPVIAVSQAYSEMGLAIGFAAQRVGMSESGSPGDLLDAMVRNGHLPREAATIYSELTTSYHRAVAERIEPTPEEAGEYERYADSVIQAVQQVGRKPASAPDSGHGDR